MINTDKVAGPNYLAPFEKAWYYFRRYPIIPVGIFFLLVFVAIFAPMLAPFDPAPVSYTHLTLPTKA